MSTISTQRTNVSLGSNGDYTPLTITATGSVGNTGNASSISNAYGSISNFGTITNTVPANIQAGGINQVDTLVVTNAGLISSSNVAILDAVGRPLSVTNTSTGRITGGQGIALLGAALTLINQGAITTTSTAIRAVSGTTGSVSNTGVISGLQGIEFASGLATVTNSGTISGIAASGVRLGAGGVVTDAAGGLITGFGTYAAVAVTGAAGTVSVAGTVRGGIGVMLGSAADTLTLAAGGTIVGTGGTAASLGDGADAMLLGPGVVSVTGTVDGGAGTDSLSVGPGSTTLFGSNAQFVNFENGSIAATGTLTAAGTGGFGAGLTLANAGTLQVAGSLDNAGAITNTAPRNLVALSGGTLANLATGRITNTGAGFNPAVEVRGGGVFRNLGTVTVPASNTGVLLNGAGATLVNGTANSTGALVSGPNAVYAYNGTGTVTNFGTLQGSVAGVRAAAGANISNGAAGSTAALISGGAAGYGIFVTGGALTLGNFGTVTGGSTFAVAALGAGNTVTNAGLIASTATAAGSAAVRLAGGTLVDSGTITGVRGAVFTGSAAGTMTLAGGGAVIGTGGTAVSFGAAGDSFVLGAGTVAVTGTVDGGAGTDTLSVGAVSTTLTGTGASFVNFEAGTVAAGGRLTLAGSNTFGTGLTLTNSGTIANTGTLAVVGTLNNAGSLAAAAGTVTVAGVLNNTGTATVATGFGLAIADGGRLTNAATGTITDTATAAIGAAVIAGTGTGTAIVQNDGTIAGGANSGIRMNTGGTLSLANGGLISSASYAALRVDQSTLLLNTSGAITSGQRAILVTDGTASITNSGTVRGAADGILILRGSGSTVSNSGTVQGSVGVDFYGLAGRLSNSGTISGTQAQGVRLEAGGTVSNMAGGVITGGATFAALGVAGGAGTVSNAGTLSGAIGAAFSGSYADALTLSNGGTIIGTRGTAVSFGAGDDTLALTSGAIAITGRVTGDAGTDSFVLGAGGGTITGTALDFETFETGTVAAGGTWALAGTGTIGAGIDLTAIGTLNVLGSLTNAGRIDVVTIDALRLAGSLTNSGSILSTAAYGVDGGAGAAVTNTGSIGAAAGIGVRMTGGNGTVTSSGRISGLATALSFTGGNSRLVLRNGYAFSGAVTADGTGNAVQLQGSAGNAVSATYSSLRLSGFGTVGFAAGASNYATLRITSNTMLPGTISNFTGVHDTVDLTGLVAMQGTTAARFDAATNRLAVVGQNGTVTLQLDAEDYSGIGWVAQSDGAGGTAVHAQAVGKPTIAGTVAGQAVADDATKQPFSAVTVSDANGTAAAVTATITLTAGGAASDADGGLSGAGLSKSGTGTYTLSAADAAALTTALRGLVFTPTRNQVATGSTVTTGFTLAVTDAFDQSTTNSTTTVVASPVAPTVTGVTASPADATLGIGATATFSVALSEPVTVSGGTPTLSLNDGGTASYTSGSGTGTLIFTTTIASGQNAADLAVTGVALNGATVADPGGSPADLSGAVGNPPGRLAVDGTAPTYGAGTAAPAAGSDIGVGQVVTFTVPTSEPVTVTEANGAAPALRLNANGATAAYTGPVGQPVSSLTFSYTVRLGDNVADLVAEAVGPLPAGTTIRDGTGNDIDPSSFGPVDTGITVDTTAPTASSTTLTVAQNAGATPIGIAAPSDNLTAAGGLAIAVRSLSTDGTVTLADGTTPVTAGQRLTAAQLQGLEFTPRPGAAAQGSTFTYTATDGAGNTTQGTAALNIGAAGAPTITGTHASATASEAPIAPFAGVKVSDPSSAAGATETLVIQLTGAGGTLSDGAGYTGTRTLSGGGNAYQLTGTAAQVTQELDALSFTPAAGAPGAATSTTFVLTDRSSAGPSVVDSGTSVADTAAPAPPAPQPTPAPIPSPNPAPVPTPGTVSISPHVSYQRGVFVLAGTASSPAGVRSVEISAVVDGVRQDLGAATVNADGTFTFQDRIGAHVQGFITATLTDGAGNETVSADTLFSLTGGLGVSHGLGRQTTYSAGGNSELSVTRFQPNGQRTTSVRAPGQIVDLHPHDVVLNHRQGSTTFVYAPSGETGAVEVIRGFKAGGRDHDTIALPSADFNNSIANVLRNTGDVNGSAFITDPVTGDAIVLAGVRTAELKSRNFSFH